MLGYADINVAVNLQRTQILFRPGALLAFFSLVLIIFYSLIIEPNWIEITHYTMNAKVHSSLKLAHITDLHIHKIGSLEHLIQRSLLSEKPDIIFVTGDLVDKIENHAIAFEFLKSLQANLGVWAVNGNWENWIPILDAESLFENAGVKLLVNQVVQVRPDVIVFGFDDLTGSPPKELPDKPKIQTFCINLFHSPSFFDQLENQCSLSLAGHTHGGQVSLPLIGPMWLPEGSGNYVSGWYQSGTRKMYVSRGIGTSLAPIRFLSRPELMYLTVEPE